MTNDERATAAEHLTTLAAVLGADLTDVQIKGYLLALDDLPLDTLRDAMQRAMRECRFFPRPAELRELAGDRAPDAGLLEALLVKHLASRGGERRLPDDPFLRLVIARLGGLRAAGDMPSGVRIGHLGKLVGGCVAAARARGLALPSPAADLPAICQRETEAPMLEAPDYGDPRSREVPEVIQRAVRGVLEARDD